MSITKVKLISDSVISDVHIDNLTTGALTEGTNLFYTDTRVGNYLSTAGYDKSYTVSAISTSTTAVKDYAYIVTADLTLTLPATPSVGNKLAISNMSGVLTVIVARNGENIQGLAEDMVLDVDGYGIELMYSGATKGWVII